MCEGAKEELPFMGGKLSKEDIVSELTVVEELHPSFPPSFAFGSGVGGDSVESGPCCTQKRVHEVISGDRSVIRNPGGICSGRESEMCS
jgi:hypothetical protein